MSYPEPASPNTAPPPSTNTLLVAVLLLLAGALVYQTVAPWLTRSVQPAYEPRPITPRGELGADEQSTVEVFRQASPAVVFIQTKGWQPFLLGGGREEPISSGTGFVWDQSGYIITNMHVIQDALSGGHHASLEVRFTTGEVVDAEIIGGVAENDIAVLKVDAADAALQPIMLGTSGDLEVGQKVLAIGNPFGFDQTLSTGVIGGLNRTVGTPDSGEFLTGLIQTDAAINPGNSGGPLLDSAGRLIGVNTAIISPTGSYAGLGFAVPVDSVVESVSRVLSEASGKRRPALLGVQIIDRDTALAMGISPEIVDAGLFVVRVQGNSAAAEAGLRPWDQIIAIDGEPLKDVAQLRVSVESREPGDVVKLTIIRRTGRRVVEGEVSVELRAEKVLF
ncbi:MAG: trypsin-like peptidase domain-containing protein [Planctomycetaceae bacterium]|nr:trypsin-like peptidase domain-containing protein [Planctomycetaceae bacterium]